MKLTAEQKKKIKDANMINAMSLKKDIDQIRLQKFINNHYPIPEKFIILESRINYPD